MRQAKRLLTEPTGRMLTRPSALVHRPVTPSAISLRMSMWPLWRAVSSIRCMSIQIGAAGTGRHGGVPVWSVIVDSNDVSQWFGEYTARPGPTFQAGSIHSSSLTPDDLLRPRSQRLDTVI